MILATVGGLTGLVARAVRTAQDDYPRSPSSIIWAAVGATFGFVLGASIGNRRLAGRPAWLIAGLVTGIVFGAFVGWQWAHAEYSFARRQLLDDGLPAEFVDAPERGMSNRGYEAIGLQYGICLGVLGGTTGGWFWKQPSRLGFIANLFPVTAGCFVALGAITMNTGLRSLSANDMRRARASWTDSQTRAGALRFEPDLAP